MRKRAIRCIVTLCFILHHRSFFPRIQRVKIQAVTIKRLNPIYLFPLTYIGLWIQEPCTQYFL